LTIELSGSEKELGTEISAQTPAAEPKAARAERYAQMIVLTILLAAPAVMCLHGAVAADPDLWWHLRAGELLLQHHSVIRTDPFSRDLVGTSWLGYSWLFEGLMYKVFTRFGLMGIVGYSTTMVLAITIALNSMLRRLQPDFTLSALLTYAACFSMSHLFTPRPWMFSIFFFVVALNILLHVRRTGRLRSLAWLPLVFALWANLHIEFIYGLFAVGLLFLESLIARVRKSSEAVVPLGAAAGALAASLLATLANPFGWRIYAAVLSAARDSGALKLVSEMQAIPFRDLIDFCLLALALAALGAMAWSRRFPIFEGGLLLFAIFMSFREQRDEWLIAAVAVAILAEAIPARGNLKIVQLPRFATAFAAAAGVGILWMAPHVWKLNENKLNDQMANTLPVHAAEFIRSKGYAGPVFNDFNWGGYLVWALGKPVTIDGRTNLYGSDRLDRSIATWSAHKDWASDPDLKSAGVVIGPVQSALVQVLRMDPHYQLVYEDKQAAVFLHHA
jgi:hypothetical protein